MTHSYFNTFSYLASGLSAKLAEDLVGRVIMMNTLCAPNRSMGVTVGKVRRISPTDLVAALREEGHVYSN